MYKTPPLHGFVNFWLELQLVTIYQHYRKEHHKSNEVINVKHKSEHLVTWNLSHNLALGPSLYQGFTFIHNHPPSSVFIQCHSSSSIFIHLYPPVHLHSLPSTVIHPHSLSSTSIIHLNWVVPENIHTPPPPNPHGRGVGGFMGDFFSKGWWTYNQSEAQKHTYMLLFWNKSQYS